MNDQVIFDGDLLRFKSLEDYVAFKNLYELVYYGNALSKHLDSYKLSIVGSGTFDKDDELSARESMRLDIHSSVNHFGGLTIVSLCTTYEIATREFLYCFFQKHPWHMYEFIGSSDARGQISLKEVLEVDTYKSLISSLAKKTAASASKGKYSQIHSRIARLCKEKIDDGIIKKLDRLQVERNKIVHEKYSKSWDLVEMGKSEVIVSEAIEQLCHFGIKNGIVGKYTCINKDNTIVLEDFAIFTNEEI